MSTQALYRKWRPRTWDEFVGQEQVIRVIRNAIASDRLTHAYLFSGPRGTGKTTIARMLARAANCTDPVLANRPCDHCENCLSILDGSFMDIIEIDAASNTGVDDIRDLRDKINFLPAQGRMKVYIIDEVHMLSTAAFNALLKTLEEPPAHAMFILATTEIQKIPATVLSRCQHHEFRRFPVTEIVGWLKHICEKENFDYEEEALTLIARQATGAMRDAVSLLDQLSSTGDKITLQAAQSILGVSSNQAVIQLVDAIIDHNAGLGLDILHQALDSGSDPRQFARQMVEHLRMILVIQMGSRKPLEITAEIQSILAKQSAKLTVDQVIEMIRLFDQAVTDSRTGWYPGLSLELATAESCEEKKPVQPVFIQSPVTNDQPAKKAASVLPDEEELTEEADDYAGAKVFIRKGQQPDPSVTKEEIEKNWTKVRELIKKHDAILDATLNHAQLLEVRDGVLYLGFPRETIKNQMENSRKSMLWTSAAISNVLGKPVGVALTILGKKNRQPESQGPLVNAALQLGGKLVINKEKTK
ncbi:MAG TPA: DNA polymerase III subunit gamma/tau [Flexilinea sp.]|nr:DNA polymerase III subunit gamma/tau [Flexilinea sp.]